MRRIFLILLSFSLFLSACSKKEASVTSEPSLKQQSDVLYVFDDNSRFEFKHHFIVRDGLIYLPKNYDPSMEYSLVFILHGSGGTAEAMKQTGFDLNAEHLNFILVYPNGFGKSWDINPGNPTSAHDVNFFKNLIDQFKETYSIDPNRIYITGHSMGGMMAYRLGHELNETIAAIAPVSSVFGEGEIDFETNKINVSVLHLHAEDDPVVPLKGFWYSFSVQDGAKEWAKGNEIKKEPVTVSLPDGSSYTKYKNEEDDTVVGYYLFPSGGHSWFPQSNRLISDFFYNIPKRENRLSFSPELPPYLFSEKEIEIVPSLENDKDVQSVELLVNGESISVSTETPFKLHFKPSLNKEYSITLRAHFKNGDILPSSKIINTTILSPPIFGDWETESSSNESPELPGSNAVDGNIDSRWSSDFSDDQYIQLNLNEKTKLNGINILWETAFGKAYTIEVSNDGDKWDSVFEEKEGDGGGDFISFDKRELRYIRIQGIKRGTVWGYSIREIFLY